MVIDSEALPTGIEVFFCKMVCKKIIKKKPYQHDVYKISLCTGECKTHLTT